MPQGRDSIHASHSLFLASLSRKIIVSAALLFILALCLLLYLNFQNARQRLVISTQNAFHERGIALDASVSAIVKHVRIMRDIAVQSLSRPMAGATYDALLSAFQNAAQYHPAKDYYDLAPGSTMGNCQVVGSVIGKGRPQAMTPEKMRFLAMGMRLLPELMAEHKETPDLVLSYYISKKPYFSMIYPRVDISALASRFDDITGFMDTAYEVYDEVAPPGKNPERGPFWTTPYYDRAGNGMMVTCGIPLDDQGDYAGVLGVDVVLRFLERFTRVLPLLPGRMILVSQFGQVIAATGLAYEKEIDVISLDRLLSKPHMALSRTALPGQEEAIVEKGGDILLVHKISHAPWTLMYLIEGPTLVANFRTMAWVSILMVCLVVLVFCGSYLFFHQRFILPGIQAEKELEALNRALDEKVAQRTRTLREREALLTAILETTDNGVLVVDEKGRVTHANQRFAAMWQIPRGLMAAGRDDELLDHALSQLCDPEAFIEKVQALYGANDRSLDRIRFKDDRVFERFSAPLPLDRGKGRVWSFRDVSERFRSEKELERLQADLANVINSMPSVLAGVDGDCRITHWNLRAAEETGVSVADARGRPLADLIPRLLSDLAMIQDALEKQEIRERTGIRREQGNEVFYEDIVVFPLKAGGSGAVVRIDDRTGQKKLEEMMIHNEKMLTVGGLAAGMAHEINNPISGVMQNAQVVVRRLDKTLEANRRAARDLGLSMDDIQAFAEKRKIFSHLELIRDSGARAARIVRNMLGFARKSDAGRSSHEITRLLDQAVELVQSDYDLKKKYDFRQIRIDREYDPGLPQVGCDAGKIQQVFINLLKNGAQAMAMKAASDPGPDWQPRFCFRATVREDGLHVSIQDNGPGIPATILPRIFEPFFTLKPVGEGTGLGLSVSYFIITQNHQGRMWAESRPGEGACFHIQLPLA